VIDNIGVNNILQSIVHSFRDQMIDRKRVRM